MRGFHRPTEKVATRFLLRMLAGGRPPIDLSGALALCALPAVHMFTTSQAANARPPRGMDRFKSPMPLEFELKKEKVSSIQCQQIRLLRMCPVHSMWRA